MIAAANMIAGGFGLHRLGGVSGIAASLIALAMVWLLHRLGGFPLVAVATTGVISAVWWAVPLAKVPPVSDIFAGQMLALWSLSGGLWFAGVAPHVFPWPGVVGGFVMFTLMRFLPPVRRLGTRFALGDDLAAAGLAALITLLSAAISHGWFG